MPCGTVSRFPPERRHEHQRREKGSRGSRRLFPQTLLDLRLSRSLRIGETARIELLADVFNVLNSTAEEGLADDNRFSQNFGRPSVFVDPRRAMLGIRFLFGR